VPRRCLPQCDGRPLFDRCVEVPLSWKTKWEENEVETHPLREREAEVVIVQRRRQPPRHDSGAAGSRLLSARRSRAVLERPFDAEVGRPRPHWSAIFKIFFPTLVTWVRVVRVIMLIRVWGLGSGFRV
jgi:hypothetical protein